MGHTDSVGNISKNTAHSVDSSLTVSNYLENKIKITGVKISNQGLASIDPVAKILVKFV